MRASTPTLAELRAARDRARAHYLAATRAVPRNTEERARRWREFREANDAYTLRARGDTR